MSEPKIGRAVLEIVVDDKPVRLALDQIKNDVEATGKHARNVSQLFSSAALVEFGKAASSAVLKVGQAIVDLGMRGAVVGDVQGQFATFSQQVGETADVMIGQLREGVKGTISDFELMQMANKALGAGLVKNSQDMGTLSAGARTLGKAMGIDTAQAFETLTGAIASGRTAQLKQLGLFVDSKKAVEEYATAHRMSTSDMTDADRVAALSAATIEKLGDRLRMIPPDARDFGEQIDAAKVALTNFRDQVAVAINDSPVFRAGMEAAGAAMAEAFGPNQAETVKTVTRVVESLAIGIVGVGQVAVEIARFMVNAFEGTKVIFNSVLEVLFSGVAKLTSVLVTLAEKASALPVVGQAFGLLAEQLRGNADLADSLAVGFKELADGALDSAAAANAGFDKVQVVLGKVKAAMVAVKDAAVETTNEIRALPPPLPGGDNGPALTEENARKIAEVYRKLHEDILSVTKVGTEQRLAQIEAQKAAELAKLEELKQTTPAQLEELRALVEQKYGAMTVAALAGPDEIRDRYAQLNGELAALQTTGIDQRMVELETARQREIQGLASLKDNYSVQYAELVALVNLKYQEMAVQAAQAQFDISNSRSVALDLEQAKAKQTFDLAAANYRAMLASGTATYKQLEASHKAYKDAEEVLNETKAKATLDTNELLASSASSILTSLFGKNKAAAIVAATIDTYAAISKALGAYPWPFNLVAAAAAGAAGWANVSKIRSQGKEGFAEGTPGLDFMGFGTGSMETLHGEEAVVPRGSGHLLAAEIADAMPGADQSGMLSRIADGIDSLPAVLVRSLVRAQQIAS